ncbi:hypothetical protein ABZS66_59245 [Dactylosporangium sp. NPDC005572]|uniref:hypothetical protein n=1 Tax=Dactylosporangium sp. NPDC005572 TaxID=3156889 RepID=UPI0033A07C1F
MSGTSLPVPVPRDRRMVGHTVSFRIGGTAGMMTTGYTADGVLRRVDLRAGVHGSTLAGLADALATVITLGLQHGAPPAAYAGVLRRLELDPPAGNAEAPGHPLVEVLAVGMTD